MKAISLKDLPVVPPFELLMNVIKSQRNIPSVKLTPELIDVLPPDALMYISKNEK